MRVLTTVGMVLMMAGAAWAAEYVGYLADAKCARAGKAASKEHSNCSVKCVEGGEQIVLVGDDKKIYQIKNQAKVKPHVGHHVALQATADGDTLEVETGRYVDE